MDELSKAAVNEGVEEAIRVSALRFLIDYVIDSFIGQAAVRNGTQFTVWSHVSTHVDIGEHIIYDEDLEPGNHTKGHDDNRGGHS